MVGLGAQLTDRARAALDEVPLVHADDERAALALDEIDDAQVLLLERCLRIDQNHHDLGEADRVECIGDRKLFELRLDPGAAAQSRRIVEAEAPPAPIEIN